MLRRSTIRFLAQVGLVLVIFQCLPIVSAQPIHVPDHTTVVAPTVLAPTAYSPNVPYSGSISVTTRSYDLARTSSNLNETVLNVNNVGRDTFGKLFQRVVDGDIYAQPLYLSNLTITYTRNVVYVATEHNSVYAFDADDPNASTPLWQVNLGTSGKNVTNDYGTRNGAPYHDIQKEVGITSTPVIDTNTGTMYVVNFACVSNDQVTPPTPCPTDANPPAPRIYHHYLHALDVRTGAEKFGGPVEIDGSVSGNGAGSVVITDSVSPLVTHTIVPFNSQQELQRPGLVLNNSNLYIAFGSLAGTNPYHGWLMVYNPQTLAQTGIWNTTPTSGSANPGVSDADAEGGIWESGQAPASDSSGNLYVSTGNGTFDASTNPDPDFKQRNYADSLIKLDTSNHDINPVSWFSPNCQLYLQAADLDQGSGGTIVIPGTKLLIGAGKIGNLYVLNQDELGGFTPGSGNPSANTHDCTDTAELSHLADRIDNAIVGGAFASPAFWKAPEGKRLYYWGTQDRLKAFQMNSTTTFNHTPVATGDTNFDQDTMPGATLTVSANGSTADTGIVWAMHSINGSANTNTQPGILRAYNAETLAEIWDSELNAAHDAINIGDGGSNPANYGKFNEVTVANGKVYVPTLAPGGTDNLGKPAYLVVYGLLASQVTKSTDDGQLGSLSYAIINSPPNQIISIAPTNTITVTNAILPTLRPGLTLRGSCANGPGITIQYSGNVNNGSDGLILSNGDWLFGLTVRGFPGVQIKAPSGGGNVLSCVKASKS